VASARLVLRRWVARALTGVVVAVVVLPAAPMLAVADNGAASAVTGCDGSEVPVEEVGLRDGVLASDPVTGESAPREVVRLITGDGVKDLATVTVTDAGGESGSVVATAGHPFWVPDAGVWVDAGQLRAGQWLQTSAGTWVQITAVAHERRAQTVHNLTVAVDHTYYVGAGGFALLTHNCGGSTSSAAKTTTSLVGKKYGLGTVVENPGLRIQGFRGAKNPSHGLNQAINRGVSPSTLRDTVANPKVVLEQGSGNFVHIADDAVVVLRPDGQLVTTYGRPDFKQHIFDILEAGG